MNDLQHFGGAWECEEAYPPVFYESLLRWAKKFPVFQLQISGAKTEHDDWIESRWPDTLAYAEREREPL